MASNQSGTTAIPSSSIMAAPEDETLQPQELLVSNTRGVPQHEADPAQDQADDDSYPDSKSFVKAKDKHKRPKVSRVIGVKWRSIQLTCSYNLTHSASASSAMTPK